jgi:hypothetical protein
MPGEWFSPVNLQATSWILSWEGGMIRIICMLVYGLLAFGMSYAFGTESPVRKAQQLLKSKGYYPGVVDGENRLLTRAALTSYQMNQGLPVTGTLDRKTVQRLTSKPRARRIGLTPGRRLPGQPN